MAAQEYRLFQIMGNFLHYFLFLALSVSFSRQENGNTVYLFCGRKCRDLINTFRERTTNSQEQNSGVKHSLNCKAEVNISESKSHY